jgi:hypothetical protein
MIDFLFASFMAPKFRVVHADKADLHAEPLTLKDRSVLDEQEDEHLEIRDLAISERQQRKKAYKGFTFDQDEDTNFRSFDLNDHEVARSSEPLAGLQRPSEEPLVQQSEFQAEDAGNLKKLKTRKRKVVRDEDEKLDDYFVEILNKKPKISAPSRLNISDPEPEPLQKEVATVGNLNWLENLPSAADGGRGDGGEVLMEISSQPESMPLQRTLLQEEPLDETATSFIQLLRRRGLLKKTEDEVAYTDKRGREYKGKQVFQEISRRFRGARGGMKRRI